MRSRPADLLTQRADGRALIAGHEGGGVQAVAAVDAQLVGRQPGDGLDAGQEDPTVLEAESIGELVGGELRRELVIGRVHPRDRLHGCRT